MSENAQEKEAQALRLERASGIRNTLIIVLGVIAMVLGLFVAKVITPREPSREELLQLNYFSLGNPRALQPFHLQSHDGQSFHPGRLQGENWSLMFFGFTFCPDICPTTLATLNKSLTGLRNIALPQVYLVTVDPERDTLAALARYAPAFNSDFIGVGGSFDEIVRLATQVNVAFGKVPGPRPGTYLVDHSATIVAIDPEGRYHGFFKPPHDPDTIGQVISRLMR